MKPKCDVKTKTESYAPGFEEGFRSGCESGYDRGCANCWDEAFDAGWRAAKEEAAIRE